MPTMRIDADQVDVQVSALARGQVLGCRLMMDGAAPTTNVVVSAGQARDALNAMDLILVAAMSKRVDALWSPGNGGGGRDAGSLGGSTGYHVFLIHNPTTGATDVLFSTSAPNPVLPAGFTVYRRIGSFFTMPSGGVWPFVQTGRWNRFKAPNVTPDYAAGTVVGTTAALRALRVPLGRKFTVEVLLATQSASGSMGATYVFDPDEGSAAPLHARHVLNLQSPGGYSYGRAVVTAVTNAMGQVRIGSDDASATMMLATLAWHDDPEEDF